MVYRDNSQFAYTGNSGNTPTSQIIYETRDPTQYDVFYALRTQWVNSVSKNFWYLNSQSNASGQLLSTWVQISGGSNVLQSISDTADTPVYPSSASSTPPNNIQLVGGTGITIVSTPASDLLTISATETQGIVTIDGDTGSITGTTVTIYANNATQASGATVEFVNSGTISTLKLTDANDNIAIGRIAGNSSMASANFNVGIGAGVFNLITTGKNNCGFGWESLSKLTTGLDNNAFGLSSLTNIVSGTANNAFGKNTLSLATGDNNTAIGHNALIGIISGTKNTALGYQAGLNYGGSDSSNVSIANEGQLGESNAIRIGTQGSGSGQQNKCFIAGIIGNTVSNQEFVTVNSSTGQLGVTTGSTLFNSISVQTFTSSRTYTPTSGMLYCIVEVVGGGGGGGGAASTSATQSSAASGGAGGGYCRKAFTAASIGVSQTVTIGAGGTGGAAGNNPGVIGGNTTFGALLTANGGSAGLGSAAVSVSNVTASSVNGGSASGGDINITGGPSVYGATVIVTAGSNSYPIAGGGGNSFYGQGGADASNAPGNSAVGYGSGGGGASCGISNGTGLAGANGAAGIVIVTEFI